ncbi:family 1 glycosylhydrolase [Candidatus Dependentiae bacterium]|nr:family 1 glycosylhydrolase [Candidatus Dependentiae bacterium]
MKKFLLFLTLTFPLLSIELRWDWNKINTEEVSFPKNFIWGVSTSSHQVEGNCYNNWTLWEKYKKYEPSGTACDHYNRCHEDIALLKQLGVDSYRFSVEWSRIEPQQGVFNEVEIKHYRDYCIALKNAGIKVMLTMHHFTNPVWFENKGAFEKEENIQHFVNFCTKVFEELHDVVDFWITINEPAIYMFQGYVRTVFPPGKTNLPKASQVLWHLMLAHCRVYKAIKQLPAGQDAKIGIAHNILQFEAFRENNLLDKVISKNYRNIVSDCVVEFFKTGKFNFKFGSELSPTQLPYFANFEIYYPDAPECLDFFGLNYYSNVLLNVLKGSEDYREGDIRTDMPYAIYAEGFYRAIKQVSEVGKPIYITENGIPDAKDDRRATWIKRYTYAMSQAIAEGYDVRGFFYWSLMDNYEWDFGYYQKFGLFEVDFKSQERKLRQGSLAFVDIIKKYKELN